MGVAIGAIGVVSVCGFLCVVVVVVCRIVVVAVAVVVVVVGVVLRAGV